MRSRPLASRRAGWTIHPGHVVLGSLAAILALAALLWWNVRDRAPPGQKGSLVFYCAAGMRLPVEAVIARYREEYPHLSGPIECDFDGSGALLSKLALEKPDGRGDLYLAADSSYVVEARDRGLVAEMIPVAEMQPVIAFHRASDKKIRSLEDLLREDVKVVLANPELAAIGRTLRRLLEEEGRWDALMERVQGLGASVSMVGTVTEVANNLKLRTADVGILWDATVRQFPELDFVRVEALAKGKQLVSVGIVSWCRQPAAALRFARYLTARDRGLQVFQEMGWEPVAGDAWSERPEILLYSGGVNRPAIEETLEQFEEREGVKVTVKFGGCGILVSDMLMIHKGEAPASFPDAYLACDASFIPPVQSFFFEPHVVSETDMVLIVPKGNPKGIRGLKDLARPGLRVGMANEEHSALGALTRKLLEAEGIYGEVKKNIVYQSPSADYLVTRFVVEGEGSLTKEDVSVVYRANCHHLEGRAEIIPIDHPLAKAVQPFVVSRESRRKALARRLLEALTSEVSRRRFESVGFHWRARPEEP